MNFSEFKNQIEDFICDQYNFASSVINTSIKYKCTIEYTIILIKNKIKIIKIVNAHFGFKQLQDDMK